MLNVAIYVLITVLCICSISGMLLSVLARIDNDYPVYHTSGLVNFAKCRRLYGVINDITLLQVSSIK